MDEDAEPLVQRRLLRDAQHARELVAQRAHPVGLDVPGREREPLAATREERLQGRLGPRGRRGAASPVVAFGVDEDVVERRAHEHLALQRRHRREEVLVDARQRVGHRLPGRPLEQRRDLEDLEVARDGVRHVEVGVEAQLAQPARRALHVAEQLVAQRLERRVQRLLGPEELLLDRLPLRAERLARLLGERRRRPGRVVVGALGVGDRQRPARARHREVRQPAHVGDVRLRRRRRVDAGRRLRAAHARHARGLHPAEDDVVRLQGRGPRHRQHAHRGPGPGPAGRARLVVAQPRVGHRRRVARELARRGLRRAPHVGGGHLGQARQHHEPLDDVGLRGEQLLAAQPQPVDEPVHEEVGPHRVEPGRPRRAAA